MKGISRKIYLELDEPTEEDNRSGQMRIIEGLRAEGIEANFSVWDILLPIAALLEILGVKGINHDIKLLNSYNRLR